MDPEISTLPADQVEARARMLEYEVSILQQEKRRYIMMEVAVVIHCRIIMLEIICDIIISRVIRLNPVVMWIDLMLKKSR